MTGTVHILTMKWGTLYSADYVNVLFRAVSANLSRPCRFHCLTDDPTGISDGVEIHPLPSHSFGPGAYAFGGWPKLSVFEAGFLGLTGRALFVDLDTVILGPLDGLFDVPGPLVLIREWPRLNDMLRGNRERRGMSSVFAFDIGAQPSLLTDYLADPEAARASVRHEQAWITKHGEDMRFWPDGMIVSFKKTLMAGPILNWFVGPKGPPASAAILVFHGVPRPIDVVPDRGQRWGSFFRYGRGAVPFVREYWIKNGGTDPEE